MDEYIAIPLKSALYPFLYAIYGIILYKGVNVCIKASKFDTLVNNYIDKWWKLRLFAIPLLYIYVTGVVLINSLILSFIIANSVFIKATWLTVLIVLPMLLIKTTWLWAKMTDKKRSY